MPELPEVETMCRGIRSIEGLRVTDVIMSECQLKPISLSPPISEMRRVLEGQKVLRVYLLVNRVLIQFEKDDYLVIEPRMTGLVMLENPPNQTHLRLEIVFCSCLIEGQSDGIQRRTVVTHKKMLFWDRRGLGTVRLMKPEVLNHRVIRRLGPDALRMTSSLYSENFKRKKKAIKVALLDQSLVAGIGNIYAAEILFLAGVDPRLLCNQVTGPQWQRISKATREILLTAIEYEGSTLSDGTYRNAINGEGSYQQCHRVYDREGVSCTRCQQGKISRIVQAQRSTFFCPVCQRKRGCHPSLPQ